MTDDTCVALLPGLLCDEAVWQAQREALARFTCFVPDYGALDSLGAMAERVLDEAPARRLVVVGHSMGGRVALEVARRAPERLQRLVLMDTGVTARAEGAPGQAEEAGRLELLALAQQRGMGEMGRRWARGMVHPSRWETPLFESIIAMIERKSPALFAAQIRALLARPDASAVLSQLRCPVLLMCGRHDSWSPVAQHEAMQALLPSAPLVVIEDAGHMTTMEQPDAVNAALLRWLDA